MVRVELKQGVYFDVNENSFDMYYKNPEKKNRRLLGYYTTIPGLIKAATQFILSNMDGDADMTGFLRKWNEIQSELTEYLSKYNL